MSDSKRQGSGVVVPAVLGDPWFQKHFTAHDWQSPGTPNKESLDLPEVQHMNHIFTVGGTGSIPGFRAKIPDMLLDSGQNTRPTSKK